MSRAASTRKDLPQGGPPTSSQLAGSVVGGQAFDTPATLAGEAAVSSVRERLYEGAREAVRAWGGQEALAAELGRDAPDVSRRLNRREHKGALCTTPLDWVALVCASSPAAAEVFLRAACAALDFEPPKRKAPMTTDEELRERRRFMRDLGQLGEAAFAKWCREQGRSPSDFPDDK